MIRTGLCMAFAALAIDMGASAPARRDFPTLEQKMESAWQRYVAGTEQRLARETADAARFLGLDFGSTAAADRQTVLSGGIHVSAVPATAGANGKAIEVPDAWVHHWRGAILLPGADLERVIARLQEAVPKSSDVLRSTVLDRSADAMRVFLRVERRQSLAGLISVRLVYNTEHAVSFARKNATRGTSSSIATRIVEVEEAGTPAERELKHGDDHGFMWRWHSYWRYQQVAAGVIAECEAVTLSRGAPWGTRWIAESLAAGAAGESMTKALISLRQHVAVSQRPAAPRTPLVWSPVQSASR